MAAAHATPAAATAVIASASTDVNPRPDRVLIMLMAFALVRDRTAAP